MRNTSYDNSVSLEKIGGLGIMFIPGDRVEHTPTGTLGVVVDTDMRNNLVLVQWDRKFMPLWAQIDEIRKTLAA